MNVRRFFTQHFAAVACAFLLQVQVMAAPPANDSFATPADLGVLATLTTAGTTSEATREPAEPIYVGANRTVWYKWTAPASSLKRVAVISTTTTVPNRPAVTVFEGTSLANLAPVCIDPPGGPFARFNAVASRVYFFHVVERGNSGPFSISLGAGTGPAAPLNDDFLGAATVTPPSLPRTVAGTFVDASVELREPNAYVGGSSPGRATVWYKWTAPAGTSWIDVYLEGNAPSSGFRFFTGATLAGLTEFLPRYVDAEYPNFLYQVTPGTTYSIQVYQREEGNQAFTLNIDPLAAFGTPANDGFAGRLSLGNASDVNRPTESTVNATTETGEPLPFFTLTGTVWYSWTAPVTGTFEFKTIGGANHDTFLCVYSGTTLANLAMQGYNDDIDFDNDNYDSKTVISTTAGTVYQIQVGSAYGARDAFALTIAPVDSDLLPFRITSFTVSTPTVDLTTADATITFDITLSDLLDAPSDMSFALEAPVATLPWGGIPATRLLEGGTAPVLVSGLTYRVTRTLPAGLPAGTYPIQVTVNNGFGGLADGSAFYGGRIGVALPGTTAAITVVNGNPTITPPSLSSFTITPQTVDATAASVTVQVAAQASGLPTGNSIQLLLTDLLGVDAFFTPTLRHDGTSWTGSFVIPKGTRPGVFRPTLTLNGSVLGRDYGYANSLASSLPAGSATSFTITNTQPDCLPPQLLEFTLDQSAINLAAGDILIGGTCRIKDQNGLAEMEIGIDYGDGTIYPVFFQSLLSGNGTDGRYRWNLVINHLTPSSAYAMLVSMDDGRGNFISASTAFGTWPVTLPGSLAISGTAPDNAEVKWMALQNFAGILPVDGEARLSATAINADPDRDGVPNFLEFHFGTNPADPLNTVNAGNLPVPSSSGNILRLDFGQSADNLALGLPGSKLIGEYAGDLSDWAEVPITPNAGRFRIQSPAIVPGPGFLRLRAKVLP